MKVDTALQALYRETLHHLEQATNEGAQAWDQRYEAIAEMLEHQPPLYLAGGFSTDADFIAQVVQENRQAVYRNVRVAKYATPTDIETYTARRLDLAIAIVEFKNGGPLKAHTPLDFARLRFPVPKGKTVSMKGLAQCSVADLAAALAHLRGREAASKKASPLAQSVAATLAKAKVKGATAHLVGQTVVLRVPVVGLAKVGHALGTFVAPGM